MIIIVAGEATYVLKVLNLHGVKLHLFPKKNVFSPNQFYLKEFLNLKLFNFCRSPNHFHLKRQHFVLWPSFKESGPRGLCDVILEWRILHSRMFLWISAIEEKKCTFENAFRMCCWWLRQFVKYRDCLLYTSPSPRDA